MLERQPNADTGSYAGLGDEVDNHWACCLRPPCCRGLLSVGVEAGTRQDENNLGW